MRSRAYRLIYFGLGAALIAVVLLGLVFGSPATDSDDRPDVLEGIYPNPSSQISGTDVLEVDVPPEYSVDLWVDFRGSGSSDANWVKIPASEISIIEGTGLHSWRPGPNRIFETWPAGNQRVLVRWDTTVGLPDPGEYQWSFRVTG
jgi:hypothetical protein